MEEEVDSKKSKYSSGVNIIIRLDSLWKDTHRHSRDGQYSQWNGDLDRIWLELARDLGKEEDAAQEDEKSDSDFLKKKRKLLSYDNQIAKLGGFQDSSPIGFNKTSQDVIKKRDQVYRILMDKQLFLARIENELGKGTTEQDEEEGYT